MTKNQVLDILDQIKVLAGQDKLLMFLLLLTGMRRGEVLGLRWEDAGTKISDHLHSDS